MLLRPVLAAGVKVLFDAPKPVFLSPTFRCADWFNRGNPGVEAACSKRVPRWRICARRLWTASALSPAAIPRLLCGTVCRCCAGGDLQRPAGQRPLFFDGDHLSAYGNARLYPGVPQYGDGADDDGTLSARPTRRLARMRPASENEAMANSSGGHTLELRDVYALHRYPQSFLPA